MDYIRIKTTDNGQQTTGRDAETQKRRVSESESKSKSASTVNDIKELLKDWIKLYPNSFAPDMEFRIFQLEDGDIIVQLHEDMSSLAVSLLVLYLETQRCKDAKSESESKSESKSESVSQSSIVNSQQLTACITIDDTEVLLKQNVGKRAKLFGRQRTTDNGQQSCRDASTTLKNEQDTSDIPTAVRFLLEDNYVLDYDFERKPKPVKDSGLQFEEPEFVLPEGYETLRVDDVIKNKIDKVLEQEGLTSKKLMWYFICGAIGLAIGFLIVYLAGM